MRAGVAALAVVCVLLLPGCDGRSEPVRVSREALGTIVTITVYGDDSSVIKSAIDEAFGAIAQVESVLSAYPDEAAGPDSALPRPSEEVTSVVAFNLDPYEWHRLPSKAAEVMDRTAALGVSAWFSPTLLRVVGLYRFEDGGAVPDAAELERLVRAAHAFETKADARGLEARFAATDTIAAPPATPSSSFAPPAVGLDFSGAAKGAALDAALGVLETAAANDEIEGALVSAGSTTLVAGRKPGTGAAAAWRVGIEDPRDPEKLIGVVEYSPAGSTNASGVPLAFGTVSTSGDYQQSFVRDGIRYHHILDPASGEPARGLRSLTVVGAETGLDSDVLSTALFVMGPQAAEQYATEHGLGLFIVDAQGRTRLVPGPADAAYEIRASDS